MHCAFEQVKFLRDEHRHIFWFECEKVVHHDDRDVEFIMFKREITKYLVDYLKSIFCFFT